MRSREDFKAAIDTLRDVGSRARVYLSMPVIEGITPRALVDSPRGTETEDPSGLVRKDGIFRLDEVGLSPMDHVALYGDGVFEGILIRNRSIFLYKEHMDRLDRSLAKIDVEMPVGRREITEKILETCRQVAFPENGAGYIRLVVTRGMGDLGINPAKCVTPTIFAIVSTIRLYSPDAYAKGIPLGLTRRIRRPDPRFLDPTVKGTQYLNNVMALLEGTKGKPYVESLMLTAAGFIAEATVDNIFAVVKGEGWESDPSRVELWTPVAEYCLPGITRQTVIGLAEKRGYRVRERRDLLPIDLVGPDKECFMTGTGAGVMPITEIEGVEIGDGTPGPVTMGLVADIQAMMNDHANGLPLDTPKEALATSDR